MMISKEIIDYLEKNRKKIIDHFNECIKYSFKKKNEDSFYSEYKKIKRPLNAKYIIYFENKEPINISYCYNDDLDDYIEICTNTDLYHFAKNKMQSIIFFIRWFIHKWMDLSYINHRHINNKYLINEYSELITINKKINVKNINYIISEYWNHCKFNKEIFNIDDFFDKYKNIIYLYFENTSLEITEPNAEKCLYWAKYKIFKLFYNNIYPVLYFNYNLYPFYKDIKAMDSLF